MLKIELATRKARECFQSEFIHTIYLDDITGFIARCIDESLEPTAFIASFETDIVGFDINMNCAFMDLFYAYQAYKFLSDSRRENTRALMSLGYDFLHAVGFSYDYRVVDVRGLTSRQYQTMYKLSYDENKYLIQI